MIFPSFSFMRDTNIFKYCLRLFALFQCFGWHCRYYSVHCSDECAHCRDINNCFQKNETCDGCASDQQENWSKTQDDLSSTILIVLIGLLSTLLVTTWLLIATYAFIKRRRGRLQFNETHGAVDIRIEDQDVPHHYEEAQDIDSGYTYLDHSAQETHYEDLNKRNRT